MDKPDFIKYMGKDASNDLKLKYTCGSTQKYCKTMGIVFEFFIEEHDLVNKFRTMPLNDTTNKETSKSLIEAVIHHEKDRGEKWEKVGPRYVLEKKFKNIAEVRKYFYHLVHISEQLEREN